MNDELILELTGKADKYVKALEEAQRKTEASGSAISTSIGKIADEFKNKLNENIAKEYTNELKRVQKETEKASKVTENWFDKLDRLDRFGRKLRMFIGDIRELGTSIAALAGEKTFTDFLGLDESQKSMVKFADASLLAVAATSQVIGGMSDLFTKAQLLAGGLFALKAALVAGVAVGAYKAGKALGDLIFSTDELNNLQKESIALTDKWAKRFGEATDKIVINLKSIPDTAKRATEISNELGKAERELEGYKDGIKNATINIKELIKSGNLNNKLLGVANKELEDQQRRLSIASDRVEQLNKAYKETVGILPQFNNEAIKATKNLTEKLDEQLKIFGMTSNQVDIYKVKVAGASDEMLKAVRNSQKLNDMLKEFSASTMKYKEIVDNIQSKRIELDTELKVKGLNEFERSVMLIPAEIDKMHSKLEELKLSPELKIDLRDTRRELITLELEFKKLSSTVVDFGGKQLALNQTTIPRMEEVAREIDRVQQLLKRSTDIQAAIPQLENQIKLAEAYKITAERTTVLLKLQERQNKLLERGEEVTKQFLNPFQVYENTVDELNSLLRAGTITQDVYTRALEDADKKLKDISKDANKAKYEIDRFNGIKFGSAEAKTRMEEFQQRISSQVKEFKKLEEQRLKVIVPKATIQEKATQTRAEQNVRELLRKEGKLEVSTAPEPRVIAPADKTLDTDRKEMIGLLKSIDNTMKSINGKPLTTLGAVNIAP